jgi:DUF1680 family protein
MLRLLPSLPGYIYAQKGQDLFVNLFVSSDAQLQVDGQPLEIVQKNNYPWNGLLSFTLLPVSPLTLTVKLRIPGWIRDQAIPSDLYSFEKDGASAHHKVEILINGKAIPYRIENGYAVLNRTWQKDDRITMNLPMPVEKVIADLRLTDDSGKVAIQRGPLMYCAEWKDNGGKVSDLSLSANSPLLPMKRPDLLEGVTVLSGQAVRRTNLQAIPVTLIPYYAWANRGKGEMTVWLPVAPAEKKTAAN